jgi:hypothetical protein
MISTQPPAGFFSQLARPFTGEELFDCLVDLVFFIKNIRGEYVVVNQTLVERCGRHDKNELIGRRAENFPNHRSIGIVLPDCELICGRGIFRVAPIEFGSRHHHPQRKLQR